MGYSHQIFRNPLGIPLILHQFFVGQCAPVFLSRPWDVFTTLGKNRLYKRQVHQFF